MEESYSYNADDNLSFYIDNDPNFNIIASCTPSCNLTFHGAEGKEIAQLNWGDGVMKFSGNIEESAKHFFEFLKPMVDEYIKSKTSK